LGRVWQFVRRHWRALLALVGVGAAAARPDILQRAVEHVFQGALNILATVVEAVMTGTCNVIARNGQFFENLFVLVFIILGLRIMFRGLFRRGSKK
jgi:hypothetical protein